MCQNEPNPESQIKDFRGFSSLRELGNAANGIFYSSQYWESQFLPFSCFPNIGKAVFRRFLVFQCWESRFSLIFDFPPWRKAVFRRFLPIVPLRKPLFTVFRSSYPYESFFLPFFINCTPYLSDFLRKCMPRQALNAFGGYCMSRSTSQRLFNTILSISETHRKSSSRSLS